MPRVKRCTCRLHGELGEEVEVALLHHLGAQPFALAPYPKHLENPGVCPICQSTFDASTRFYALPCGHRFHIVCLLKALQESNACTLCRAKVSQALYMVLGLGDVYPRP